MLQAYSILTTASLLHHQKKHTRLFRFRHDAAAVFSGAQITGWWKAEREVRWQPAEVEALDARVHLGKGGAQVWYASAWIRAETETAVKFIVHSMPQARVRLTLDDTKLFDDSAKQDTGTDAWMTASVPATLTPGWHRLHLRTYAWGYGSAKAGVAIDAPLERLWGLSCSGRPPQAGR